MGKARKATAVSRFARSQKSTKPIQDSEEIARMACKEGGEVEKLPPHCAVRHPDLRAFWEKCVGRDEISWDTFWLHFPTGLAPEVLVDCAFSSQNERSAFQAAMHVVGAPEHVNVSMLDATYPPGCPIGITTARLLKDAASEQRMTEFVRGRAAGKHVPLSLQRDGFWDEPLPPLPSLASLSAEVEAELSSAAGQRTAIAQVFGHNGSGAADVAVGAARKLLAKGIWTSAVCVNVKGASSAEVAAARVASALRILSYPVVADELLRLTAYLHSRAGQSGRLGIVLNAEGCSRSDELNGLSVLVTTLVKAGGVQIIVAGEGSLRLASSTPCAMFRPQPSNREEEIKFLETAVQGYILEESAAAVAAVCGHQLALMRLAVANLQTGKTLPQTLIGAMCASANGGSSPQGKSSGLSAETVVNAVFATLMPDEQEALRRLSVLPTSFVAAAAAKVLGQKSEEEALVVLQNLEDKGFLRRNRALCTFGMLPSARAVIRGAARVSSGAVFDSAIVALVEHSLELAETAAALNASNSQLAAMWVVDREREIFDEVANLLHDSFPLPAVTTNLYADLVSKHMELLGFRLSIKQQQELCTAVAVASGAEGDVLAEAHCLQHLGQVGNIQAADGAMATAMATAEKHLTPTHPVIADMLLSWARLQSHAGNNNQAEKLLRRSLEIQLQQAQGKPLAIAATRTRLAGILIEAAQSQRARPYLQTALDATARELGPHHPDTALAQCRLASCLADLREYNGAHALYLLALDGWRQSLGHCHPQFATLLGQLAFCCIRLRKVDEAEHYYRRSIQMWKEMMILDQPELQDDLRALADLLQAQGRGGEAMKIREQLHRLVEAVRAAHHRFVRKPRTPLGSLKKALLRPLKALVQPPQTARPAVVALPAGIQDSDLEELRKASKTDLQHQIAIRAEASTTTIESYQPGPAPQQDGIQECLGAGTAKDPIAIGTSADVKQQHGEDVANATAGIGTAGGAAAIVVDFQPLKGARSDAAQQLDSAPGSARSAKPTPRQGDKAMGRAATLAPHIAPFGSKGPGPSTVEASKWAASLRNPAIPLNNVPKRGSTLSAAARNDSSVTKNRLFTPSEGRYRAGKPGGFPKSVSGDAIDGGDDLIRAHTVDEKDLPELTQPELGGDCDTPPLDARQASLNSESGYATDDSGHDRHAEKLIGRMGNAAAVGKNVIGFYNPTYAYGLSRTSSQAASMLDEKAEM